jgi:hypothetical protein
VAKNYLTETELKKRVKESKSDGYEPMDFTAERKDGKWEITFTYLGKKGYELHTRRTNVRKFATLSTVANCLSALGVTEFKVIL